jgi:hypothetical protein
MTVYNTEPDVERELGRAGRVLRRANVFFLVNLARIVDITGLREGDDEKDYFVDVPASQLHEVDQRIADLEYEVRHRFDAEVSAMAMAIWAKSGDAVGGSGEEPTTGESAG